MNANYIKNLTKADIIGIIEHLTNGTCHILKLKNIYDEGSMYSNNYHRGALDVVEVKCKLNNYTVLFDFTNFELSCKVVSDKTNVLNKTLKAKQTEYVALVKTALNNKNKTLGKQYEAEYNDVYQFMNSFTL